jgi:hypothetical protein
MPSDPFLTLTEVGAVVAGVLMLAVVCSLVFDMDILGRGLATTVMFWLSLLAIALGATFVLALLR